MSQCSFIVRSPNLDLVKSAWACTNFCVSSCRMNLHKPYLRLVLPPRADRDSARRHHSHADPRGHRPVPLVETPPDFDNHNIGPMSKVIHPHTSKNLPDTYSRQQPPLIPNHSHEPTRPQILSSSRADRHRSASKHSNRKDFSGAYGESE
jgi:hypothetical protein